MDENIKHNKDITYFAKTNFRNKEEVFGIKRKDRRQHMYILGKSGTGKSVLLSNLITQNIQNGEGVCVVDPHGELAEEILEIIPENRVKDVIYFNPADTDFNIGFNVLQIDDPKYKHLVASGLMGIFTKIWANAWSARMEYILNNAILALLETPGTTLLGIPRLLTDKDYRQTIIGNLKDPIVKAFWIHEYEQWKDSFRNEAIAPIQNKVGQFLSSPIIRNVVGQQKSTINIFDIMNEGKIFIVNVSKGRIGEDNSALLGGMIITKIQLAAMERVRIPEDERKDFYLYVDEFQNFATESFANILSEARKYRLNLVIAHQYIAQIESGEGSKVSDAVFGNVGTMIIFRVGAEDGMFLEKEFEPEFTSQDLVSLPNFNIYLKLMIDGITSRPFSATTLPPIKIDKSLGIKDKIIESSRNMYAKPKEDVEDDINRWSGTLPSGENGEPRYKVDCFNCKKSTMVPFEPKDGRPVYCRDCMSKIKTGEIKAEKGFSLARHDKQENNVSTSHLAMLGIEFNQVKSPSINFSNKDNFNNKKSNDFRKPFNSSKQKSSLKDLLEKIKKEEVVEIDSQTKTNQDNKKEKIETISLSSLSKPSAKIDTKEASEEKKSLLRNILNKALSENSSTEKKETVESDITAKKDQLIKEKSKEIKDNDVEIKDIKENKNNENLWQKNKNIKEVPEEVLKKILE